MSFVGEELNYQGMTQNAMKNQLHFEMRTMEQMPFLFGKEKAEEQEKEFVGEEFQCYDFFFSHPEESALLECCVE